MIIYKVEGKGGEVKKHFDSMKKVQDFLMSLGMVEKVHIRSTEREEKETGSSWQEYGKNLKLSRWYSDVYNDNQHNYNVLEQKMSYTDWLIKNNCFRVGAEVEVGNYRYIISEIEVF